MVIVQRSVEMIAPVRMIHFVEVPLVRDPMDILRNRSQQEKDRQLHSYCNKHFAMQSENPIVRM